MLSFRPQRKLGKGLEERLDSWNVKSCSRDSLRDGDRCGGDIRDLALERVAQFPPLYAAGDSDINFPFEVELLTRFW